MPPFRQLSNLVNNIHKRTLMKFCKFLDSLLRKSLFNHIIFGNRNIILRHMRITNATVSKLNQFIEPKTTFAAFLSEGMKEK